VCDGDQISYSLERCTLDLHVPPEELASRLLDWRPPALPREYRKGVLGRYVRHVGSASKGAVLS
jgi:dihydroxy-acid dehydratase